jgi:hypothetical protein
VIDAIGHQKAAGELPCEVLPEGTLGVEALEISFEECKGVHAGGNLSLGQDVFLRANILGFEKKDDRTELTSTLTVLDSDLHAVGPKPITQSVRWDPAPRLLDPASHEEDTNKDSGATEGTPQQKSTPTPPRGVSSLRPKLPSLTIRLRPSRPGRFILRLDLKDAIGNKTARYDMPVVVHLPNRAAADPAADKALAELAAKPAGKENPKLAILPTFGRGGSVRPARYRPGETVTCFVLATGLGTTPDAKVNLTTQMTLLDAKGEVVVAGIEKRENDVLQFGGSAWPVWCALKVPQRATPGKGRIRIQAYDIIAQREVAEELPIEVLPADSLAITDLQITRIKSSPQALGGCLNLGMGDFLTFSAVGFTSKEDRAHLTSTMRVLSEEGKPLCPTPYSETFDADVYQGQPSIPVSFLLHSCREGRFILHVEVKDHLADKTATYDMPIAIHGPAR